MRCKIDDAVVGECEILDGRLGRPFANKDIARTGSDRDRDRLQFVCGIGKPRKCIGKFGAVDAGSFPEISVIARVEIARARFGGAGLARGVQDDEAVAAAAG